MNLKSLITVFAIAFAFAVPATAQTIQSSQAVTIDVRGVPEEDRSRINGSYPVSQNGNINMPFIGQVRAAGLLPEQLASNLQSRYKQAGIYLDPTFQVFATTGENIVQQVVHVGGYVNRSGAVPYQNGMTLWQAIQAAGGENAFGSIYRVRLFRGADSKVYDLTKPEAMRIPLRPNDMIDVPQKNWRGR